MTIKANNGDDESFEHVNTHEMNDSEQIKKEDIEMTVQTGNKIHDEGNAKTNSVSPMRPGETAAAPAVKNTKMT